MSSIFGILSIVGYIIMAVGGIWILVKAFQESILWGLGSLFIPFVVFFFIGMHWQVSKKPFFIRLIGFAVAIISMVLTIMTATPAVG